MRILTADDVASVLTMAETMDAVAAAAVIHSEGRADAPARYQLATSVPEGEMLVMPAVVDGARFGLKLWHRFDGEYGTIPRSSAMIMLLDPDRGEEVLMDGAVITDLRTGAMTGVAARYLAVEDASELAVIGAGIQARTQILAVLESRPSIREVRIYARTRKRLDSFVASMAAEVPEVVTVRAAESAAAAATGADIVIAATTSTVPVIGDSWVKDGALVCGVGSHDRQSTELQPATVARAVRIAVDTIGGGVDGALDISGPIEQGLISRDQVVELGDLVAGTVIGRPTDDGVTVFKSIGFATSDVVVAELVAARAAEAGTGAEVDLHAPH